MELRQFWSIIRAWWWLWFLGLTVGGGTAYVTSMFMLPVYSATATLEVSEVNNVGVPGRSDSTMNERLIKTYTQLIGRRPVLDEVDRQLGLNENYNVEVSAIRDTLLIQITVRHKDPQLAADVANKVAEVFIERTGMTQSIQLAAVRQKLRQRMDSVEEEIRKTVVAIQRVRLSSDGGSTEEQVANEASLQNTLNQHQFVYSQLVKSELDTALAEVWWAGRVEIRIPATTPQTPIEPKVLQNTMLAAVVGLMLMAGIGLLVEYLDDTVKTRDDVAQATSLPTIGAVGMASRRRGGNGPSKTLIASNPQSQLGEAYRVLRSNLQFDAHFASLSRPATSVLLSSCTRGEGKSFTLANLGLVLAQAGNRTIMVDANLRHPSLHNMFGLSPEPGLSNLLLNDGSASVPSCLQETGHAGLRLLAVGHPLPPSPSELLSSSAMVEILKALKQEADVILLDSPPALDVADAAILSSLVDGVLLVVGARRIRRVVLAQGEEVLKQPASTLMGVVLNRFKPA